MPFNAESGGDSTVNNHGSSAMGDDAINNPGKFTVTKTGTVASQPTFNSIIVPRHMFSDESDRD